MTASTRTIRFTGCGAMLIVRRSRVAHRSYIDRLSVLTMLMNEMNDEEQQDDTMRGNWFIDEKILLLDGVVTVRSTPGVPLRQEGHRSSSSRCRPARPHRTLTKHRHIQGLRDGSVVGVERDRVVVEQAVVSNVPTTVSGVSPVAIHVMSTVLPTLRTFALGRGARDDHGVRLGEVATELVEHLDVHHLGRRLRIDTGHERAGASRMDLASAKRRHRLEYGLRGEILREPRVKNGLNCCEEEGQVGAKHFVERLGRRRLQRRGEDDHERDETQPEDRAPPPSTRCDAGFVGVRFRARPAPSREAGC